MRGSRSRLGVNPGLSSGSCGVHQGLRVLSSGIRGLESPFFAGDQTAELGAFIILKKGRVVGKECPAHPSDSI